MPLIKSSSKKAVSENIRRERAAGKPRAQSIAIALSVARRARKRAEGGEVDEIISEPWVRNAARIRQQHGRNPKVALDDVWPGEAYDDGPTHGEKLRRLEAWQAGEHPMNIYPPADVGGQEVNPYSFMLVDPVNDQPPKHLAAGGEAGGQSVPWYTRQQAHDVRRRGVLKSNVPGRTDKLNMNVKAGSYVVPADIVSGLGQGNTDAGAQIISQMFSKAPFGMKAPKPTSGAASRRGTARLTKGSKISFKAAGGQVPDVPVIAAGGEYILDPDQVMGVGNGDLDLGHKILDQFVVHSRKELIKTLKGLPGPAKE